MGAESIRATLDLVRYKNWWIEYSYGDHGMSPVVNIRWAFTAPDASKPGSSPVSWSGRWWEISADMDESAVVKTAFLALKVALEHEAMEAFSYADTRIFDPHVSVSRLRFGARAEAAYRASSDGRIHP